MTPHIPLPPGTPSHMVDQLNELVNHVGSLLESGSTRRVELRIAHGRIWRIAITDAPPLDSEKPRAENLSVGEEPSTP